MSFTRFISSLILEALFPLSRAEKEVFSLSPEKAFEDLPKAPTTPVFGTQAVFAYKDERIRKLVWSIKYKRLPIALDIGGFAIYERLRKISPPDTRPTVIIPMPITEQRRRERGYNQTELLLETVKKFDVTDKFVVCSDLLLRTLHTARQTLKDRRGRLENAKGVFSVNKLTAKNLLQSQKLLESDNIDIRLVIIDDVITTGSTMNEAIETLKCAGFTNVSGISLAH